MALPMRQALEDPSKRLPATLPELGPDEDPEDGLAENWVWLLNKSERAFNKLQEKVMANAAAQAAAEDTDSLLADDELAEIDKFTCFVPRAVLEAIVDGKINAQENVDIIIDRFKGALVFCDASGFTAVTEAFNREPNGAERLGNVINDFFTSLIQIINFWGGDIIKFAGDAVTIIWGVDDIDSADEQSGGYHIDPSTACKLACQCCLDLHRNLNGFPAGIEDRSFSVHIGVGFGPITILQVGGTLDRWDFVVAGPPVTQISIAEPLAASGETVLSPEVVATVGKRINTEEIVDGHHKLISIAEAPTAAPPPLERIHLRKNCIRLLRRFIPPPIYQRLHAGFTAFTNELRQLSVIFVSVKGLDVDTDLGSIKANALMQHCQKSAYLLEGSVNKLSVDDKGVVVLLMFGLPPVYHMDDPIRAVLCGLRVAEGLKTLGLGCGIGIATGRVWIGTVGCDIRKEYTALGDTVNLAARLMGTAGVNEVLCDKTTQILCSHAIEFQSLPSVKMKGKADPVPLFRPPGRLKRYDEQRSIDPAVSAWPAWRQAAILRSVIFPRIHYRPFVDNFDVALPPMSLQAELAESRRGAESDSDPDMPIGPPAAPHQPDLKAAPPDEPQKPPYGPQFPWEIKEPWMPTLRAAVIIGGVMVIKGREVQGSLELVEYLKELAEASGRHVFVCSNTPESTYLPVANVALLAFRRLCTDIVYRWRNSPVRKQKGYTVVDEKNSIYSLTKELTHPLFHWRLSAMKTVVKGLVLPKELAVNQPLQQWNHDQPPASAPKRKSWLRNKLSSRMDIPTSMDFGPREAPAPTAAELLKVEDAYGVHQAVVVPAVCSLINGYTMNEKTVIIVKVRQGTCLYSCMDADSWKALALLAHMAVLRRRRRIELECQTLRRWRRLHSWNCAWCKGLSGSEEGEGGKGKWSSRCRPPVSTYFPSFLLVVVCSQETDSISDMSRISAWARECGLYMNLGKLSRSETRSFLSYYFKTSKKRIPSEVVDYVHRVSAGYLNYVALTARQLLHHDAVETRPVHILSDLADDHGADTVADDAESVTSSESEVCDFDTVQERSIARNALLPEHERRVVITRRRLFPTTSGVLVGFRFEGNNIAQLRGCVVHRDIVYEGNPVTGMGAWVRKQPSKKEPLNFFSCPGPVEYAERELHLILRSRVVDRIFGPAFPHDNEKLARFIEPSDPNKMLMVVKDLRLVPYIAQLRAATMMLIEALKPEEQLVAKCASVFTVAFCFYELCAISPKAITLARLEMIVESLLRRELLEICDPPADNELADLSITSVLKAFSRHSREDPNSIPPTDDETLSGPDAGPPPAPSEQTDPADAGGLTSYPTAGHTDAPSADNSRLMAEVQEAEEELLRHASMYVKMPAATSHFLSSTERTDSGASIQQQQRLSEERPHRDPAYGTLRFDDQIIRPKDKDISTFSRTDVQGTKSSIPICQTSTVLNYVPSRLRTGTVEPAVELPTRTQTSRAYLHRFASDVLHAASPPASEGGGSDQASEFWAARFAAAAQTEGEDASESMASESSLLSPHRLMDGDESMRGLRIAIKNPADPVVSDVAAPSTKNQRTPAVLRLGDFGAFDANGERTDSPPDLFAAMRKKLILNVSSAEAGGRSPAQGQVVPEVSEVSWEQQCKSSFSTYGASPRNGHRYRTKLPASTARLRSAMHECENYMEQGVLDQSAFINNTVESLQGKTLYGIKADGVPVFYRFTSTAYQHVLADLLTSYERNFIADLAKMVVTMRKHYGLPFLVLQVQMRGATRRQAAATGPAKS